MTNPVIDNVARRRYELEVEGQTAFIDYLLDKGVRVLTHAETPVALRGRGIAGRLTAGALQLAREHGDKVLPRCPYVVDYMAKHPEYHDLDARA